MYNFVNKKSLRIKFTRFLSTRIVKKIKQNFGIGVVKLNLVIIIYGAPLYRSSKTNVLPVLGRITNIKDSSPSKPPCLDEFLSPLIEVMKK
jgi:hypothetical protein